MNKCYGSIDQIIKIKILSEDWHLLNTKSLNTSYKEIESISDLKCTVIKAKEKGDVLENEKKPKKKKNTSTLRNNTEEKSIIVKGLINNRFESDNEKFILLRKKGNDNLQTRTMSNS